MKNNWMYFLLAFAAPILGIFWWIGGFTTVRVEPNQMRGPYHYAYLEHHGDYARLPDSQIETHRVLLEQGIKTGAALTLMENDPRSTGQKDLYARTGYLVDAGVQVREPLKLADIPARQVLVAQVRAHPRLATGKAYTALLKYLDGHGMKLKLPTLEIYRDGELSVEMDVD